jgi:hypothetical protein
VSTSRRKRLSARARRLHPLFRWPGSLLSTRETGNAGAGAARIRAFSPPGWSARSRTLLRILVSV